MKIAITSDGNDPGREVESRFGRCPWIMVYDTGAKTWEALSNSSGAMLAQGAGVQTAELLARKGVQIVITGHCGPKAIQALSAAGIKVYRGDARTAQEALAAYQSGRLTEICEPNGPGR